MKMRSWLLTALLGGSVLVSAGSFSTADARSGAHRVTPQTSWALSKVANNATGGDYCTMARRFSNNLILTVARNTNNETSLALDFQRDTLNAGKTYTVSLTAGGITRAFDVSPVSSKAFVIRTGQDEEIFSGIRQSGILDVNLSGQVYRFVINDMESGDSQLGACVASLVQPAAGSPSMASAADGPTPMPGSYARPVSASAAEQAPVTASAGDVASSRELEQLRDNLNDLRAENNRLSSALAASRRDYENRMQETDSSSVVSELREKLNLLERENSALRKSVSVNEDAQLSLADKQSAIQTLEERIASLESENSKLQKGLAAAKSASTTVSPELSALRQEKSVLEKANQELQARLDSQMKAGQQEQLAAAASMQKAIEGLEGENTRLQQQLDETRSRLTAAQAQLSTDNGEDKLVKELEKQLSDIAGQKRTLENEIASLRRESQDFAKVQAEMAAIQSELAKARAENVRLSGELTSISAAQTSTGDDATRLAAEVSRLNARIAELETENKGLYKSFETARTAQQQNAADKDRLAALESEVGALQQRLATAESENQRLTGELQVALAEKLNVKSGNEVQNGLVASLKAEIDGLRSENVTLRNELASALDASSAQGGAELERQKEVVDGLQRQIRDLESENLTLQASLDQARSEYQEKLMASSADKVLQMEVESLEAKLEAAERANARLNEELQAAIRTDGEDPSISSANWNLEVATRRYSEAESEIRRLGALLDKERAQCSAEVFELEAKLFDPIVADQVQIEKLKDLQGQLQSAEAEQLSCSQRIAQLETELSSGQSRMAALTPVPSAETFQTALSVDSAAALNALETSAGSPVVDTREAVRSAPLKIDTSMPSQLVAEAASSVAGASVPFMSVEQMGGLLRQAGIVPVSGTLETLDSVSGAGFLAFRWDTGDVYGTAEQSVMENSGQFELHVTRYLDQAKSRCPGDFAAIPAQKDASGGMMVTSYEIACVGDDVDSSASIVFFTHNGLFTSIAHETGTEQMDVAMDLRDALMETVSGSMSAFSQGL